MRIVIVGSGYVGLVTGACLAESGHAVTCIDSDQGKVTGLRMGTVPFSEHGLDALVMRPRDAELAKHAANAMLATRISFMDEIARLCGALGADVEQIRRAVGSDARIGSRHLQAGCGFGGSCLPKDLSALADMSRRAGVEANILEAVQRVNALQKRWAFDLLVQRFGPSLRGCRIAVWGLAFKPQTDDLGEAPSHALIASILEAGGQVAAHDPLAMPRARNEWPQAWFAPDRLRLLADPVAAAQGADAVVLATEWPVYRSIDFAILRRSLRGLLLIDGRNQFDPLQMARLGYEYCGVGRGLPRPSCLAGSESHQVALITAA